MKKCMVVVMVLLFISVFGADYVSATNITIFDGDKAPGHSWWNTENENDETEPGTIHTQIWDLEAFHLDNNDLTMGGGYNFQSPPPQGLLGDVFIDVDGDGSSYQYGYDYVIDFNGNSSVYDIYKIDSNGTFEQVHESINRPESDPWQYHPGATAPLFSNKTLSYDTYAGHDHSVTFIDLGDFVPLTNGTLIKFTMKCGNDNMKGRVKLTTVSEPATMILLGIGIVGIAAFRRQKKH